MTKKEKDKMEDLERRMVILEKHLIESLMGLKNNPMPPVQPNAGQGGAGYGPYIYGGGGGTVGIQNNITTCPNCGQSYPSHHIHACPNSGGGFTWSGTTNAINNAPNITMSTANGNTPLGTILMKSTQCPCGFMVQGQPNSIVICPNCNNQNQI